MSSRSPPSAVIETLWQVCSPCPSWPRSAERPALPSTGDMPTRAMPVRLRERPAGLARTRELSRVRAVQPLGRVPPAGGPAARFEALRHLLAARQAPSCALVWRRHRPAGPAEGREGRGEARRWTRSRRRPGAAAAGGGVAQTRRETDREKDRDGETGARRRDSGGRGGRRRAPQRLREEGAGAGPSGPTQPRRPGAPAPFPAGLPPAAPAGTWVKQEPMSCKA